VSKSVFAPSLFFLACGNERASERTSVREEGARCGDDDDDNDDGGGPDRGRGTEI
jgi:hypothetical protein